MRGKGSLRSHHLQRPGITPAYAGKSEKITVKEAVKKDHPCVCGEKLPLGNFLAVAMGSPLRMRGKDLIENIKNAICRITPAYAGKSFKHSIGESYYQDHPCVCGEKVEPTHNELSFAGSPLRMRGKDKPSSPQREGSGITPAYAGKRGSSCV